MYQYSLSYFIDLFSQAITKSEKSSELKKRLENLKQYFLYSLYSNICRSLFEKDKLLLSFLLCYRLSEFHKIISPEHFRFLLTGGVALDDKLPETPHCNWISNKMWGEVFRLSTYTGFDSFYKTFYDYLDEYQKIYDSPEPHKVPLPLMIRKNYTSFQKLLILRCIRPDKVIPGVMEFIVEQMG
jgi:dynein heavy chain